MERILYISKIKFLCFLLLSSLFISDISGQWTYKTTVSGLGIYPSVSVVTSDLYYVAGGSGTTPVIYKTTDAGVTFSSVATTGIPYDLTAVWGFDENIILVSGPNTVGGEAKVYKTTDGGANWTAVVSAGSSGWINDIVFSKTNPNVGIVMSDPLTGGGAFWLAKTTDGGDNWIIQNPTATGTAGGHHSSFCIDENFYGFGTNAGNTIVFTTDGGSTWQVKALTGITGGGFVSSIAFSSDKQYGLAIGSNNATTSISRTVDGGLNWSAQTIPNDLNGYVGNIKWIYGTSTVFLIVSAGNNGGTRVMKSTDNGANWFLQAFPDGYTIYHADLFYVSGTDAGLEWVGALNNNGRFYYTQDDPLPVQLKSFTSIVSIRDVKLSWVTEKEVNNRGFDIERLKSSETGVNSYEKIGYVEARGNLYSSASYSFDDKNLSSGKYKYRLKQIDYNGNYEYFELNGEVTVGVPKKFNLSQNYPNPFNPVTKINFDMPEDGKVNMRIYDLLGREVATIVNDVRTAGYYTVSFDASKLSSGMYFYRLSAGNYSAIKKMAVIK